MSNTYGDVLVPASVVLICAAALASVAQLGPDRFSRTAGLQAAAATSASTVGSAASASAASGSSAIMRVDWKAQPAAGTALTRIGFGSCFRQKKPAPIWQAVARATPDTFLMMGDNVYGDFGKTDGAPLVQAYAVAARHGDFAKAIAAVPFLATWDDHDYGSNDGGADFAFRATSERLFRQFWAGSGTLEGVAGPGIAYARRFGPVGRITQIIMLDTRSFRSPLTQKPDARRKTGDYVPDADPAKTMLGDAQWQWLGERLSEPADLRLIVSSVQVLAEGHTWERWGNLPKERERLIALIDAASGAKIILSGDRHRAAFYRIKRAGKADIIEATSSSLNASYPDANERGPHQIGQMYGGTNFGMIDIDWTAGLVTLSLRGEDGKAAAALAVPVGG